LNNILEGSTATKLGNITGRGGQLSSGKWRGRGTFWNDVESTYFQKLSSAKLTTVFDSIRHPKEDTKVESRGSRGLKDQDNSSPFMSRHLDEFFSFYGFYQEVINELQDNCNYQGKY